MKIFDTIENCACVGNRYCSDRSCRKKSYAALQHLVIKYRGDAEKAWDEWVYDEWRFNLGLGFRIKGKNWKHVTAEDIKENLVNDYCVWSKEWKLEIDWWRDMQNRPDIASELQSFYYL